VEASAGDALEFVSCGIAVRGVDLRAPSEGDALAELEIRGPSLMEGYLGAEAPWASDGYLRTHDLARLDGSELFIIGRTDDTISASGRNVYAPRLEEALWQLPELRAGCVVLVSLADGRYACVAEAKEPGDVDITQTGRRIRSLLARMSGLSPSVIAFVERGTLPKTPSGKIQRIRTATLFEAEQLPVFALQTFGA
jgi:acyl-CoA synthetase (AMP-forming)/AMP-acid ligase II